MNRSHDAHFFHIPKRLINGEILPPRISLDSEVIAQRHINAVVLSHFAHNHYNNATQIRRISDLFGNTCGEQSAHSFLENNIDEVINTLLPKLYELAASCVGEANARTFLDELPKNVLADLNNAREYYFDEIDSMERVRQERIAARNQLEAEGKDAGGISRFISYLAKRVKELKDTEWTTFLSGRNVLPRYAFPIYNVNLETSSPELKLDRDLRIALSEYVPGAEVIADGKLWKSEALRIPPNRPLPMKFYARCPQCWHVERNVDPDRIFADANGFCPVCEHDGRTPSRPRFQYLVPR